MDQSLKKSADSAASRGGAARMSQLDHAGRQALGRKAAEARWGKTPNSHQTSAISHQQPDASGLASPAGAAGKVDKPRVCARGASVPTASRRPAPKAFRGAHSYAEKRLAEAIKERAQAMNKLSMLEAEIPSLVAIIKALRNTPQGAGRTGGGVSPEVDLGLAARPPLINRAQGGAGIPGIGNPVDANEDEDVFLRESPIAQGDWH